MEGSKRPQLLNNDQLISCCTLILVIEGSAREIGTFSKTEPTIMRFLCLTTTFVLLILIVVLFCADMPFVIASNSKVDDGNENRYTLCYSTSEIDRLLSNNCVNFRKRAMWKSGENILQSPEKAQRFLQKRITYVTNYGLFLEECCHESSCRVEEILEHCAAPV
ncbi:hypothetical protein AWC38_SpisGene6991 [Stylophora pistillata]|uniref:Insulin-like domain-containing protein n=1 Tax=Stylophora pistillata TaxID=50429 RepID=A0A2B4SIH5_STYPI|nr:hypothetical protein AWC38_SpisGene6991 [Stylophora pistillata]